MASHRRTLAAAFATLLVSVSLYPIFIGTLWFLAGLGSVTVVAAAGTVTRLRRLPVLVCLSGGVLALLLYLNAVFASASSLYHVLPTPASIRLLWGLAGQGFTEAAQYAPPVPELRGMVLLAAGGIGITALFTDLIAVRLSSAGLAGLPLLVVFTEPFTLSVARGFLGTTVAFILSIAGYLALLSSEGRDRIREWEHEGPSARDAPDTRTLAAAGRRVGFASVLVALLVPLVIPGLHVTRLFGGQPGIGGDAGGGHGSATVGFPSPNTQIARELHMTAASNVLVYSTADPAPDYLQLYVLDKLTSDSGWQLFSQPESLVSANPRLPAPPGLTTRSGMNAVTMSIAINRSVGQDAMAALPVPYPATSVSAPGAVRADRATLMVFDPGTQLGGLQYKVTSLAAAPPEQALNSAPPPAADIAEHYLQVPPSYDSLRSLAESVVRAARAKTPFEEAVALQDWFTSGAFKYTLNALTVADARGLTRFLKVTRSGYCLQFSFAMAVLARLLGIPSRVAYGFTSGTSIGASEWLVTTHDAHAWPELYFQGYGWLRFEPTPPDPNGAGTATTPAYTLAPASGTSGGTALPSSAATPTATGGTGSDSRTSLRHQLNLQLGGLGNGVGPGADGGTLSPWEVFGLVVAGLLVFALAAPRCARLVIRRHRWRAIRRRRWRAGLDSAQDAARDTALANAAWRELRDDLTDYGAGYRPSESPRAVAARTGTSLGLADPARAALGRIALAEERSRYAGSPADGSGLHRDSVIVRRAIAAAVPRRARWRAMLLPASVLGPAQAMTASAADIFGRLSPEWLGRFRAWTP